MLEIRDIHKHFGSQPALASVSLNVSPGEFFSILGPSGCGKSTLLRIIAGLENASHGEILWQGRRLDHLAARERPFNMVFQRYALFPHLSVFENVAFGLRIKRIRENELRLKVNQALEMVGMKELANRAPETLSGGQAQRAALARAFVNQPSCVLLDEPLSALDQSLREHMQAELRVLQRRLGMTFVFVTHDQEEALLLSDRIAVMNRGVLEQVCSPRELFESPSSIFTARFIGRRNELPMRAVKREGDYVQCEGPMVTPVLGRSICKDLDQFFSSSLLGESRQAPGVRVAVFVRPDQVMISKIKNGANKMDLQAMTEAGVAMKRKTQKRINRLSGWVQQISFRGDRSELTIAISAQLVLRAVTDLPDRELARGDEVGLEFAATDTLVFLAEKQLLKDGE